MRYVTKLALDAKVTNFDPFVDRGLGLFHISHFGLVYTLLSILLLDIWRVER